MTAVSLRPPGIAASATLRWVRLYTAGMSEAARSRRQQEIESDLWDHHVDMAAQGAEPAQVGIDTMSRLLRGVPADIAWRFQVEGVNVNIHFPVERLAGLLLLFLIIPFVAGGGISGYDLGRTSWPGEFARFSDMSSRNREITALAHGAVGLGLVAMAAQFAAILRDRSPRLVALGTSLLIAAGVVMLVNAGLYRAMSSLADDHLATGDPSLVSTARSFGMAVDALAMANMATTTLGIACLAAALRNLALVPRWTGVLPLLGVAAIVIWATLGRFDGVTWVAMVAGQLSVALWLIVCGAWMLLGGGHPAASLPDQLAPAQP